MHPHGLAFDKGGTLPGPGPVDRAPSGQVDSREVVAIHDLARHGIGLRPVNHVRDRHLEREGRGVGVLVIVTEEHHRQFADRRKVQGFMEVAATRSALTGVGHDHAGLAAQCKCQSGARGNRQVVGQVADERDDAALEVADMDVPVFPSGGSRALSEVLRDYFARRDPADQKGPHVAVERSDNIVRSQCRCIADRDRLHAAAGINPAHDPPLPIEGRDTVFQRPGKAQIIVHLQQVGSLHVFRYFHSIHDELLRRWQGGPHLFQP